MNNNFLKIVKQIITEQGEDILSNPKRVSAFFADLARDIPKPQKNIFIKCLEHGFVQTLKSVSNTDLNDCKQKLSQKLHEEEGLDLRLCEETLNLLVEVLFGKQIVKKEKNCRNCGKELQEDWINCPYCSTHVNLISSAISSGSGSYGYGIRLINQTAVSMSKTRKKNESPTNRIDYTNICKACLYYKNGICKYYGCDILESIEYDCGMKDENGQKIQQINKRKQTIIFWFSAIIFSILFPILYLYCFYELFSFSSNNIYRLPIVLFGVLCGFGWGGIVLDFIRTKRRDNARRLS